jgi:hypothetical protein
MGYRDSECRQKAHHLNGTSKPRRVPEGETEEAKNRQRAEDQGVRQKVAVIGLRKAGENYNI